MNDTSEMDSAPAPASSGAGITRLVIEFAATLLVALPLALLLCLGVWMPGPFRGALERCAAVLNGGR